MSIKFKNKKTSFLGLVATIAITLVCSLGLSACTWFTNDDTTAGNSNTDADGNLRVSSTSVSLVSPNTDGSVDENTGSFVWDLSYYVDAEKDEVKEEYDQLFYNTEFFDNPQFTASEYSNATFLFAGATYTSYNDVEYSVSESGYYRVNATANAVSYDRVDSKMSADKLRNIMFLTAGTHNGATQFSVLESGYYLVETINGKTYAARVYAKYTDGEMNLVDQHGQSLKATSYRGYYFRYPSYTVSVSGISYQIKVEVNYDNLVFDFTQKQQMFKLADGAKVEDTFNFYYRVGGSGNWISCETGYNMASAFEKDGKFYVRFNPMLAKGSTTRYIRVQTNVSAQFPALGRGNSVYTSPINFNAYKMTFALSCNNSTQSTYESLLYNSNKYYFALTESALSGGLLEKDYYTSVTGYFVEGRIVEVDRYMALDGDYAFQSWTVNGKADNTVVLSKDVLPNNNANYSNYRTEANKLSCLNINSKNNLGVKEVGVVEKANLGLTLTNSFAEVIEYGITDDVSGATEELPAYNVGTLYAVASNNTASNVAYANIAKVKNFILSGTVYDGDNFFSAGGDAVLGDVDLYIWRTIYDENGTPTNAESPFARFYTNAGVWVFEPLNNAAYEAFLKDIFGQDVNLNEAKTLFEAGCSYKNSQFIIENLAWDCYISFGKTLKNNNNGNETQYTFYSAAMTKRDGFYTLDPHKSEFVISDRAGNAIIGTALDAESNVEVNIYITNDAGNNLTPIDEYQTAYNGIQYQVVSTTNTKTDAFGYTTSSVIISLLLPSNCSLTAYNMEHINSIASTAYMPENAPNSNTYILCDIGYNEQTRTNVYTYYYVESESLDFNAVSDGQTLNCLLYDGQYYQYTHRDSEVGTDSEEIYNYYYEYAVDTKETLIVNGKNVDYTRTTRYIIKRSSSIKETKYIHYVYTSLHDSEYSTASNPTQSGSDKIVVSQYLEYNDVKYGFTSQSKSADINVIATGYATDLQYIEKNSDGDVVCVSCGEQTNNTTCLVCGQATSNTMYVYYNVVDYKYNKSGSNLTEYYYTAPVGKRTTTILNGDLSVSETTITWFHSELNNILSVKDRYDKTVPSSLVYGNHNTADQNKSALVMLGADILRIFSGTETAETIDTRFYLATGEGKVIIADNYYYIAPLGEPTTLLVSQYFNTSAETVEETNTIYAQYVAATYTYKEDSYGNYYINDSGDYVSISDGDYAGQTRYSRDYTSADYALVDGEYVYDPNGTQYPNANRYTRAIYQGNVYTHTLGYNFALGGLLKDFKNQSYVAIDINHVKNDNEYGFETKVQNANGTYSTHTIVTSMNSTEKYLYNIQSYYSYSYKLSAPDDNTNNKQDLANLFLNQETNNQVIKNISNVETTMVNENEVYYLKAREYYGVYSNNTGGAVDDKITKYFTTEYKFYTYSLQSDTIYENTIYFDGTNFYIALNSTVVIVENENTDEETRIEYPTLAKLNINADGTVYYDGGEDVAVYIEYLKYDAHTSSYKLINTFANSYDGKNYINLCLYQYYEKLATTAANNPTALGTQYYTTLGYINDDNEFEALYYSTNLTFVCSGQNNEYYTDKTKSSKLYPETVTIVRKAPDSKVVRRAVLQSNTTSDVHLLGKVVLLGEGEVNVYPSFNYNMPNTSDDILNVSDDGLNYYSIDYTTVNSVIQAFPGVKILSGAPYVNPIMYFEVKHKADERAVVEIGLEITNGYYVEVITNAITSTTKNLIYDFSTVSFKDTVTNLTSNDYINRMYYVLDMATQNSIIAYTKAANGEYEVYLSNTPLTILNIGLNEDDTNVYSKMHVDDNGKYNQPLYYKDNLGNYVLLNTEELIIWDSSATAIEDLPTFDIHNYYVADNGLVILTSDGKDNEVCSKVEELFISGTGSTTSEYDYSEVLIGGFTSAYRVNQNVLKNVSASGELQSYWWEDAISIANNYHSTDPYFLTDKEGAVLVASPIVQLNDNGENIIYKFKRWAIYSRYNSEVLYYNAELSDSHIDRYNAVMRFSSKTAGYFVFMPIYERIYTINVGTSIENGPLNMGGSVSVIYDGTSVDLENSKIGDEAFDIYFVKMLETTQNDITQYYYSDFNVQPILYFTGEFMTGEDGKPTIFPKFEARYDIIQVKYTENKVEKGLYYTYKDGKLENLPIISEFQAYKPGIVEVTANSGNYTFKYVQLSVTGSSFINNAFYARSGKSLPGYAEEQTIDTLLSHTYSVNYYLDGVSETGGTAKSKVVFYYKKADEVINDNGTPDDTYDDSTLYINGFEKGDNYMYAIDIADLVDMYKNSNGSNPVLFESFDKFILELLGKSERFATTIVKQFNSFATATDGFVDIDFDVLPRDFAGSNSSFYFSELAYLDSGELYSYFEVNEETGKEEEFVHTTQQFKTSYFERDSKIIISASADLGYRLKDWYLAEYNEKTKSWIKSSTALSDAINASYDDIIRNVYYNPTIGTDGTWYYVTEYNEVVGEHKIYYYDKDKVQPATVPTTILDSVRGYYAQTTDTYGNPMFIPVYRKDRNSGQWYTDPTFNTLYTGEVSNITIRSHYESIRTWFVDGTTRYLIGNIEVWKHNGQFYRTKDIGNMMFKDNMIFIYNLHNEIRVIAEFVEVYQALVFAENSSEQNIEVVSLYYEGVRSNMTGETLEYLDKSVSGMEEKDFYDKEGQTSFGHINQTYYIGYDNFTTLRSTNLLKAQEEDEESGEIVDAKVNLVNMRFDVETTIYIVVRVYYNKTLTIHTLGMNTQYEITPVLYPTDSYISQNLSADEADRDDHYFYIFKVTFNRDLAYYYSYEDGSNIKNGIYLNAQDAAQANDLATAVSSGSLLTSVGSGNYNPEYVVHVNRAKAIVADVLNGNYSRYYSYLFKFYDQDGEEVKLEFNEEGIDKGKVRLDSTYADKLTQKLIDLEVIDADTATNNAEYSDLMYNKWYSTIRDLFIELRDDYGYNMSFAAVSDITDETNAQFNSLSKIYSIISDKFTQADDRITGPQYSGATNFINLSSIPIYTYSTSIEVISNINSEGEAEFDEEMVQVLLEYGIKLKQKLYTRGGYQGYTYIGLGEEGGGSQVIVNGVETRYPHTFTGNTDVPDYDINYVDMFEQEYALAKDTIMVLEGIDYNFGADNDTSNDKLIKSDGGVWYVEIIDDKGTPETNDDTTVKYVFTGWFEQKKVTDNNGRKAWGDLQLVSNDITTPFASVAYADTNIIAVFERAVDVEVYGANNSASINFNSLRDSLNKPIEKVTEEGTDAYKLTGTFTISSNIAMDITPSGGYRFSNMLGIDINGDNVSFTEGNSYSTDLDTDPFVSFGQDGLTNPTFADLNLVKTINVGFVLGHMLNYYETEAERNMASDTSATTSSILSKLWRSNNLFAINLNMIQVQLTYITIDGYTCTSGDNIESLSGYEFNLYYIDGAYHSQIVSTQYSNGTVKNVATGSIKDSAQRPISVELNDGNLSIYGYFDFAAYNGKLYIESVNKAPATLKAWYINTHGETHDVIVPYAIKPYSAMLGSYFLNAFRICYVYNSTNLELQDQNNGYADVTLSDEDKNVVVNQYNQYMFNLSENNFAYLLSAKIQAKSSMNVAYATIEDIKTLDETISFEDGGNANYINKADMGSISWTGALFTTNDNGDEITVVNGVENLVDSTDENGNIIPTTYSFFSDTKVTFSNSQEFYIYTDENGKTQYYKFIGWFSYKNNRLSLVSESVTYHKDSASGSYVAVYAKLALIKDAYTETIITGSTDYPKNQNGIIEISSSYTLNKYAVAVSDDQLVVTQTVNIKVYGTSNALKTDEYGKAISCMYAVVGSSLDVSVTADANYLINDIVYTVNGQPEISILEGVNGSSLGKGTIETIVEIEPAADNSDANEYVIIGRLSRGFDVNIIQVYYDSIAMNNTGEIYSDQSLVKVERADAKVQTGTDTKVGLYTFAANTPINLTYISGVKDFGLIGYYINGHKIDYAKDEVTGEYKDLINLLATYTVTEDITIEVRITKYVQVRTTAQNESRQTLNNITSTFSYSNLYTDETITHTLVTPQTTFYPVLSGTIVTFNTFTTTSQAFIRWEKTEKLNATDLGKNNDPVSYTAEFELSVEYGDEDQWTKDIDYTFVLTAIYVQAFNINVEKIISSYNYVDRDYRTVNADGSITWAPEFLANLDVSVTYTDILGETHTVLLGTKSKLDTPLKAKSGTTVKVVSNISKAVENRYSAIISINNEEISQQVVNSDKDVEIEFYAKRKITMVRQVNNQEFSYDDDLTDIKLEMSFVLASAAASTSTYLPTNISKQTWDVAGGHKVTVTATQDIKYTFAGFYINGIAVGAGEHDTTNGIYSFYIEQPTTAEDGTELIGLVGNTYYTYDTDITIVALWYETSRIIAGVNLDGVNILTDEAQTSATLRELSDLLVLKLVGNKITESTDGNNNYNTTLQPLIITNENYYNLPFVAYNNLALIASQYAGYQFVGFFYRASTSSEYTKLDFCNYSADKNAYNFGDTLTSILEASTLEAGVTYYVEARYVTAWQVSQLVTITNQSNTNSFEDKISDAEFFQVAYVDGEPKIINDIYSTYSGTTANNYFIKYFYPHYSPYIAVYFNSGYTEVAGEDNPTIDVVPVGYYVNGVWIEVADTITIENISYAIINVLDYINAVNLTNLTEITKNAEQVYDFNNLVIERKYVKCVDYVVRIGVENTSDISKLRVAAFNGLKVTINYSNPYTNTTEQLDYSNGSGNTYWNTSNSSLYIKLRLPIGTTISTSVNQATLTNALAEDAGLEANESIEYKYNGWFMYANHSIAGSTSVINYTNAINFVLTNDTDIVAQYFVTKIDKTTDTQYSYRFNGQDFIGTDEGGNNFDHSLYSPAIQGTVTNASTIATTLTNMLKTVEYNNKNISFVAEGLDTEKLEISTSDGIIFEVTRTVDNTLHSTYKFMFMGWYQEIKDSRNPSTFLFVTNKLGLNYTGSSMPAQMQNATNMVAIFTQIVELKLKYADGETVNSLNYANLKQKLTQVAPMHFTNASTIGNYLNVELLSDGTLVWNTLYSTLLSTQYYTAFGYHYDTKLERYTQTWDTLTCSALENVDQVAIKYLKQDDQFSIANTSYKYTISSKDSQITALKASDPYCDTTITEHYHPSAAATSTSALSAGGIRASLAVANTFASSYAKPTAASTDDIVIEESEEAIKAFISGQVITPNGENTGITFNIDIRFPDGTTESIELSKDKLFNFLANADDTPRKLPLGTTIYIQTLSIENKSEILESVKLYYLTSEAEFIDGALDLSTQTDYIDLAIGETTTIIVSEALNGKYLRVMVSYKNVFNVELEENNNEQGQVAIIYTTNTSEITTATAYNVNVNSLENFAFNDLYISFVAGNLALGEPNFIETSLLKLIELAGFTMATNLTDTILAIAEGSSQVPLGDGWTITLSNTTENGYQATLTHVYNEITYASIELNFVFNTNKDDLDYTYITGFTSTFVINTNVQISTEYLHVTTVQTNSTTERFNANITGYTSSEIGDTLYIYVFDNDFFTQITKTVEIDGHEQELTKYIVISKLDDLYSDKATPELQFLGYSYSGGILSENSSALPLHLVFTEEQFNNKQKVNDIIIIEAVFVEQLTTNIGIEIDYYNDEISDKLTGNPNILNTPLDELHVYINNVSQDGEFVDLSTIIDVSTNLNQSSDLTVVDDQDYFSFIEWRVKYQDKYLAAIHGTEDNIGYYSLDQTALSLDANLYKIIINQYKASASFTLDENKFAKFNGNSINLEDFVIIAYMQEEVVELTIKYEYAGETFNVSILNGNNTSASVTVTLDDLIQIGGSQADGIDIFDDGNGLVHAFLITQTEVPAQEIPTQKPADNKLILVYSKSLINNAALGVNVVATQYNKRSGVIASTATLDEKTAIRHIESEDSNFYYSQSQYLKLNGYKDSLGNVVVSSLDEIDRALVLRTCTTTHSGTYKIDTSNLYLIELGMALYTNFASIDNRNILKINGEYIDGKYLLNAIDNYGAVSLLIEEGTAVKIDVENFGNLMYQVSPTETSYKSLAISHNYTVSDLYAMFHNIFVERSETLDEITYTIKKGDDVLKTITYTQKDADGNVIDHGNGFKSDTPIDEINEVPEFVWRAVLGMNLADPNDYENDYYTTLNQYSNYYVPSNALTYTFIATQNTSFVADYIGLFKEQKRYISVLLNADESIKYTNNSATQTSYSGENFVITIAYKNTAIELEQVVNDEIKYTMDPYSTIVKTSDPSKHVDLTYSIKEKEDGSNVPVIKFTNTNCQIAIGLVTNKYVEANISVMYKYVNYNPTIMSALKNALDRVDPTQDEPTSDVLLYNWHNSQSLVDAPKAYVLDLTTTNTNTATIYFDSNKDNPEKYPLSTNVNLAKNGKIALLAEHVDGYTFVGFKITSQMKELTVESNAQHISTDNTIFIAKQSINHTQFRYNDGEEKLFYYCEYAIDGNATIVALYEPNLYLLNITHLSYDEQEVDVQDGEKYNPDTDNDPLTTQGKIITQSLVVSSGDIVELTILTNGFAEYKGMATGNIADNIQAIYSLMDTINNPNASNITNSENNNEGFKQALERFQSEQYSGSANLENKAGDEGITYKHYGTNGEITNVSDGVTRGYISSGQLFTSDYSTKDDNGEFEQNLASTSFLYLILGEVTEDINLYAYFNSISYTLNIEFNEFESGYTNFDDQYSDKVLGNSPYIAYAEELRTSGSWVNPSADSKNGYGFGIADDDPYVYTWFDNYGNALAYPVKLTRAMVDSTNYVKDSEDNYLALSNAKGVWVYTSPEENDDYRVSLLSTITVDGKEKTIDTISNKYASKQVANIYDYLEVSFDTYNTKEYKLVDDLFKIVINSGGPINSGDLEISASNVKQYASTTRNTLEIRNIIVDKLATLSVTIDFFAGVNEPSIKLKLNILPDKNSGFPMVAVEGAHEYNGISGGAIKFSEGYVKNYNGLFSDGALSLTSKFEGIEDCFFADAFIADEETGYMKLDTEKYPKLELDAVMVYQRLSKYSESEVEFSNLNVNRNSRIQTNNPKKYEVTITNPEYGVKVGNLSTNQVGLLDWINQTYHTYKGQQNRDDGWCDQCDMFHNCNNGFDGGHTVCSMIDLYYMYSISNAQIYIDAIEDAANRGYIDKALAIEFIAEFIAFDPTSSLSEDQASDIAKYEALPKYGSIFDYLDVSRTTLAVMLWSAGYPELYYRLTADNTTDLCFTQLDVYSNFKNVVNKNFFGNSINYGDLIVNVCKLADHTAPHQVKYDVFGNIWEEYEPGYVYINSATADYGVRTVDGVSAETAPYTFGGTNDFITELANISAKPNAEATLLTNWFAGVVSGKAKYIGTYNYVIHSGLMPTTAEFTNDNNTTFVNSVKIDLSDSVINLYDENYQREAFGGRIKTDRIEKVHGNIIIAVGEVVVGVGIIVGSIALAVATWGQSLWINLAIALAATSGVILGAVVVGVGVRDGIMIYTGQTAESLSTIHNEINNLDFTFY